MKPREARSTINRELAAVDGLVGDYATNISRSGVFIRSQDPLPVGTVVDLCFSVILDDVETFEGIGEVTRVSESPRGMGVAFLDLDQEARALLERMFARAGEDAAWQREDW
jgi:hypothetical protein